MSIKIVIAGPRGRMGSEAVSMVLEEPSFSLIGCVDRIVSPISIVEENQIPVFTSFEECLYTLPDVDVLIDLTVAESGFNHIMMALEHKVRCVVGTTGFTSQQLNDIQDTAVKNQTGCIVAPNFAIGAVLMMHFSKVAAKFFPDVEIIEKHHAQKIDAPSGTALKTVEMIKEVRKSRAQGHIYELETMIGARGATDDGVHIHSVRLPGHVAHQEVIFGGDGQTLTIKHDSINRKSFMEGIKLSVKHVMQLNDYVYGLENILDLT
ncbi:4-hydroxy-tetrahydrodipicolinate reductase [Ornithinibacillus bavariensis]|uniref:4-hydroxy-tetrahydrodipicolinate reductase n=1 Tax=Ornithinibacillus bavariensis TaxID=545502 RepID=UPI000EBAC0CD|nr:4-hydroxy-tetrahydrodipicolinate reductase [Ornithinibacillus sp.]